MGSLLEPVFCAGIPHDPEQEVFLFVHCVIVDDTNLHFGIMAPQGS